MGLHPREGARVAACIVNLTDRELYMYDDISGDIELLPPYIFKHLHPICLDAYGRPFVYYVVEDKDLLRFSRERHGEMRDLAVIIKQDRGRNNTLITYLGAVENRTEKVLLTMSRKAQQVAC